MSDRFRLRRRFSYLKGALLILLGVVIVVVSMIERLDYTLIPPLLWCASLVMLAVAWCFLPQIQLHRDRLIINNWLRTITVGWKNYRFVQTSLGMVVVTNKPGYDGVDDETRPSGSKAQPHGSDRDSRERVGADVPALDPRAEMDLTDPSLMSNPVTLYTGTGGFAAGIKALRNRTPEGAPAFAADQETLWIEEVVPAATTISRYYHGFADKDSDQPCERHWSPLGVGLTLGSVAAFLLSIALMGMWFS